MKKILGLDLGSASIGWALVNEAENENEQSNIIKLGVRVNPLTTDEQTDFEKGNPLSVNADRTLMRGTRRNLQRFKLRRKNLVEILKKYQLISDTTPLTETGKNSTHQTLKLRAKAPVERVELEEFARVLLAINKKRGYKSSKKTVSEEDGMAVDGMAVAKRLYEENATPGQYTCQLLKEGKRHIPDFYRSNLQAEFDSIWGNQKTFYPNVLSDELHKELQGKNKTQTWAICRNPFNIEGIKLEGKADQQKLKKYQLRVDALTEKIDLEHLAIVLQEINNDLNKSSGYLGAISDRSKELYFDKITVGQYFFRQIKENKHASLKNQVFYRQDYLDEFERIWEVQTKFHKELTPELKEQIRDVVIFYQRRLKSQKGLIRFCQFESWEIDKKDENGKVILNKATGQPKKITVGQRVIPKSSPLFQEFKIWQTLNNIVFQKAEKKANNNESEFILDKESKQLLFEELNLRGDLKINQVLKLLGKNPKEWKCNSDKVEGNRTNQALYNIYQKIAENEGYGFDWAKKTASEIKEELKAIFPALGISPEILDFDATIKGDAFDKQKSYQLWHLLYSSEDDHKTSQADRHLYGNSNVALKKILHTKYGFKPEHTKWLANIKLQDDYGSLSARAIRKILPHLQNGQPFSQEPDESKGKIIGACQLAGYNHSKSLTKKEKEEKVYKDQLELLPKNSLRNPVVEKILNQMVNLINQVITTYGKPDEVRIELARELKKSASERKEATLFINKRTKENEDIRKLITKEFGIPNPTKNDVVRYRLWEELAPLGHKSVFTEKVNSIYTNRYIPKEKLFSKEIDIEHIIPKALLFDDSFSNKTLAYRKVNLQKSDRTALDFIEEDFNSDLENYKSRIETLYNNGKGTISKGKHKKLLMSKENLPDGFIDRDLRNTQYIAKKAKAMLQEVFKEVVSSTGSITDKLREDWDLINVMKELNMPKYKALGLTEIEVRKNNKHVEVIKDWTKRNDRRHHAMDALAVAFTTHNHIQYLNNLNARKDTRKDHHPIIKNIENIITYRNDDGKKLFVPPMENFRAEAKKHIESILISFKAKNKVFTWNINKAKNNVTSEVTDKDGNKKIIKGQRIQTPRGQLHKETIYGKALIREKKPTKLNSRFTLDKAKMIVNEAIKDVVTRHLAQYENNSKTAFSAKTLKNNPIVYKGQKLKEVYCFEKIYTIRKPISSDLKIDKVVDKKIREILRQRLQDFDNKPKEAFSSLEENPIWLVKPKDKKDWKDPNNPKPHELGIPLKRVTITGVSNADPLRSKKDHFGNEIKSKNGHSTDVDYVSTGNNRHVAIYKDSEGKLQEEVVSFYEAVARSNEGFPVIDKTFNAELGWQFLFTMKQNELFVFPNPKEDFDPSTIDLLDEKNANKISKHLFRVQKIATKDYFFRHHLETTVENKKELKGISYKRSGPSGLIGIVKVRTNHLGQIVQIGEY